MRQASYGSGGAIESWSDFDAVLRESGAVYVSELDQTVEIDLTELAQVALPLPPRLPTSCVLTAEHGYEPIHAERCERETVRPCLAEVA
jgi:hypothetical protein